jgi:FemAB-related protein (PEP-CTERM system-associated)
MFCGYLEGSGKEYYDEHTIMDVKVCTAQDAWDAYVETSPEGWTYHRWIWRDIIEETYGHEPIYLAASENGTIRGVLPLVSIRSRLFGNSLISIPFFSYCGVLAATDQVRSALLAKAVDIGKSLGVRYIELRQATNYAIGWQDTTRKVRLQRILPDNPDKLMDDLDAHLRYRIRRAGQQGFRSEWGGIEAVDTFYEIFAVNMRNLGTPVYPRKWFRNICRRMPQETKILTIWDGRQAVASAFLTTFRDTLELPWNASCPETRGRFAGVWLHWTMLQWAAQNGYRCVDFGRSNNGSGSHRFKKPFANREFPLHWYQWLPAGAPAPELTPESPRYRLAVRLWKNLPLQIANQLGPLIVRCIP